MIGFSIMMWFIGFVLCMVSISLLRGDTSSIHGKVFIETTDKTGYAKLLGKITIFMGIGILVCGLIALIGDSDTGMGYATIAIFVVVIISAYCFYKIQKRYSKIVADIFKNTEFQCLYEKATEKYGKQGELIYSKACDKLKDYITKADCRNDKAVKRHMFTNILPLIAIYKAYLECDNSKEEAYDFCLNLAQSGARKKQEHNKSVGKMPFGYTLFKLFCKRVMSSNYPSAGWDMNYVCYDNKEIHFDINKCIYYDTTIQYGCPELCTVFCANDDTTLAGFGPKVIFERSGTIARGQNVCDFHFKNAKL